MNAKFLRSALFKLFLLLLLLFPGLAHSQTESYTDVIDGSDFLTDSTVFAFDDKVDSTVWSSIDSVYSAKAILVFEVNPDEVFYLPDTFFCRLSVDINLYDSTNALISSTPQDLIIHFDTTKNKPFANRAVLYFDNVHAVEVKYTNIDYRQGNGNLTPPAIFRLRARVDVLRTYIFECDDSPSFLTDQYDVVHDRYEVSWLPYSGTTDYDFEWTFYDDSSEVVRKMIAGHLNFDSLFLFNATRTTLRGTNTTIPLVYPDGYIYYRIRAVKIFPGFQNQYSDWSSSSSDKYHVSGHEPMLTWQYNLSLAEEAKKKEVVSYFDGSLRNRQTVTRINQVDTSVVAETIYDFQGRPAVKVLPSPTFNPQIRFFEKFNIDGSGNYYSWENFDTASCGNTPDAMNPDSGASRYYSSSNPLANQAPYKYISDAEGYPFSITEYTNDNTGRISRQSGVGPYLLFNDSVHHETRYFYGKPSQWELDRLFGNDVGDSSHYTQEMVIDPNGQISITYKDAHDRVIATALAGNPPPNLIQLPEYMPDSIVRTHLMENNRIENRSWKSATSFLAKCSGDYTFYYNLFPDFITEPNCDEDTICYDCYYDIRVSIGSPCSPDPYLNIALVAKEYKNYQIPRNDSIFYDTLCASPDSTVLDSFVVHLEPGSYFISRELTVSDSALNFYTEKFLRENTCRSLEDFIEDELSGIDSSGCVTCETCFQQLGDTSTFITSFFAEWDSIPPTSDDTTKALEIYGEAYQACVMLCNPFDICQSKRQLMMGDFTPGSQYARYDKTPGNRPVSGDQSSVLFWNGSSCRFNDPDSTLRPYLDDFGNEIHVSINGVDKTLEQLSPEEYVEYYDPSWAPALLKLHPEYCYLKYCERNTESQKYFTNMLLTSTYDAAVDSGYINPLTSSNPDPFFEYEGGTGDTVMEYMYDHYTNFNADDYFFPIPNQDTCQIRDMSMWDLAYLAAVHGVLPQGVSFCDTFDIEALCNGDKNVAWMAFRGLYIKVRDSIYHGRELWFVQRVDSCDMAKVGGNCCIGFNNPRYFYLGHNCITGELCGEDYFDKTPRFFYIPYDSPLNWIGPAHAEAWIDNQDLDSVCNVTCRSHRSYWKQQLLEYCGNINETQMDELLDKFQEICEHGCDQTHPFGSSTVPDTVTLIPGTFQAAMEEVLGISPLNPSCNSVVIDVPRPYNQPGSITTSQIIFPKPPECVCEKFDSLFTLMFINDGNSTLDSFAVFLAENYGSRLSISQLYEIKLHCNDTLCKNMTEAIELPQVLSCGTCLPCDSINEAFTEFRAVFADALGSPHLNELLTGFFNIRFGFHLQATDYIQFIVNCQIDTTGALGIITCDSISELFAEYIVTGPSESLDEWLNTELSLSYSYVDYSMWIYNCAFDTLTVGFIPCDTVIKFRNEFYSAGLPADSFVQWMNDTLGVSFNYLQYAAWIANCDSTDSIPYSPSISLRMSNAPGSASPGQSFQKNGKGKKAKTKSNAYSTKPADTNKVKENFERALQKRKEKLSILKGNAHPEQAKDKVKKGLNDSSTIPDTSNNGSNKKVSILNGNPKSGTLSFTQISKLLTAPSYLATFSREVEKKETFCNTLIASSELNFASYKSAGLDGLRGYGRNSYLMPGTCSDLNDALLAYDNIPSGFHPPLEIFLNNYLDDNLSFSDYLILIASCGLTPPVDSTECDSISLYLSECSGTVANCMIANCLNEASGLDFSIHEYLLWFEECNIGFIDCGELTSIIADYNSLDFDHSTPLTIYLNSTFDVHLTYSEWVSLLNHCSIAVPNSDFNCDLLGTIYSECFASSPINVTYCLNSFYSLNFIWQEYTLWLDSCEVPYIDCEKLTTAVGIFLQIDPSQAPPINIWLNKYFGLNLTYDDYNAMAFNCNFEFVGDVPNCDSLEVKLNDCLSQGPLSSVESCLDSSFQIDFTLSQYIEWFSVCDLEFINCDTLIHVIEGVYDTIDTGIRPPLTVFLDGYFGIFLSFNDYAILLQECDYSANSSPSCDLLKEYYEGCASGNPPYLIDDCLNALTHLNLTLSQYLQWLDTCSLPYDTINCDLMTVAVYDYPCWQDTISISDWINHYLQLNETDTYYLLYMDSCSVSPVCCSALGAALDTFPCFIPGINIYTWLDSVFQVSLPDSFWISMMDSCQIDFPCDTCIWLQNNIDNFGCQDTITLTQWLNNETGWSFSDSAWLVLMSGCSIELPCQITCEEIQMLLVEYPCDSIFSVSQYLNNETDFQYSDSTWLSILDTCEISLPCVPTCDSLHLVVNSYPCYSSFSFYEWLNAQLDLSFSENELQYFLDSCGISMQCDSCDFLDSLSQSYPCNDTISFTVWLEAGTGWSLSEVQYFTLLDSCNIGWQFQCIASCDSLQDLESTYPCNSGIPLSVWLNTQLDLSYNEDEWQQIFAVCPVDTLHCVCNTLDTLIPDYPCNDTLTLSEWLNVQTSWGFSDSAYVAILDSCKIGWDSLCVPSCDTLQLIMYEYPCNGGIPLFTWLNDSLGLSYSELEWTYILEECRIDSACDTCSYLATLIPQFPCEDTLTLSEWLNGETGWSISDSGYIILLVNCELYDLWQAQCDSCVADFDFSYDSLNCSTVHFEDQSAATIAVVSYQWYFGDSLNSTSTLQNPSFDYLQSDTFNVCLVITHRDSSGNLLCTDSICHPVIIVPDPTVSISTDSTTFCTGQMHTLVASGSGDIISYTWSPGGSGNDSLLVNTAGTYYVAVSNGYCYSIDSIEISLFDTVSPDIVVIGSANICTGLSTTDLQADLSSNGPAQSYLWSTSETTSVITVDSAGTYCVSVLDFNGCYVHACQEITESLPPAPPIVSPSDTANLCTSDSGLTVTPVVIYCLNYSSSLLWSTGDTSTSINVDYEDVFYVLYTDSNGCYSVSNFVYSILNSNSFPADSITSNHPGNVTCTGGSVILTQHGGALGTVINPWNSNSPTYWAWYADSCGGVLIDTGSSITVHPLINTTYFVRAEGPCGSICDSILISVTACDTCEYIDSLINIYPCNDTLTLVEWLNDQTAWNLSDSMYFVLIDSCNLDTGWVFHCLPDCDSIQYLVNQFPCTDPFQHYADLNSILEVSLSDSEWVYVFQFCEIKPCDTCYHLNVAVESMRCDLGWSLWDWLNNETGWGLSDSTYIVLLENCNLDSLWISHCIPSCDSLQTLTNSIPCNSNPYPYWLLNAALDLNYWGLEWEAIFEHCGIHCEPCAQLTNSVGNYPCNDTLTLQQWLEQQTGLGLSDSGYIAMLDSCGLDSAWLYHCIPSCDSLQSIVHLYPCDTVATLADWLNGYFDLSYSELEWDTILQNCTIDTSCICNYLDSLIQIFPDTGGISLSDWLNIQTGWNYTMFAYLHMFDNCDIFVHLPCPTVIILVATYNNLPAPKLPFEVWADHQLGLDYTEAEYLQMVDSCDSDPVDSLNCDTLAIYVDYYNTHHPSQNIFGWLNQVLGYNYNLFEYLQWFDICQPTPDPCSYYDSLYSYYLSNGLTMPVEQWLNAQSGMNYTFWEYVEELDGCICFYFPCDTIDSLVSILNNLPQPVPPFEIFANNYFGLEFYTAGCYQNMLDSCDIPDPTEPNCGTLDSLYQIYLDSVPLPDLTSWFDSVLSLPFTYWDYVLWFDSCSPPLPLPCDTVTTRFTEYVSSGILIPFSDWMNQQLHLHNSMAYYQHLLDSCSPPGLYSFCDSLDMAVSAYLAQPDTSLDFVAFLNDFLDWSLTLSQYQASLDSCHPDTTLFLCDHDWLPVDQPDSVLAENCLDDFISLAYSNAQHNYELYLDSIRGNFVTDYIDHCLNSFTENFYVDGPFSEYHYTLYYYDQAGNLTQTIPPNGVIPFSDPDTLLEVAEFRTQGGSSPHYQSSTYRTCYTYNTLNKPVGQRTPDSDTTLFWYDRVGRLVASQNAQQRIDSTYSYTLYDPLGRIIEVGIVYMPTPYVLTIEGFRSPDSLLSWISNSLTRWEVTRTYYDHSVFSPSVAFVQENLRNRVSSVIWQQVYNVDSSFYFSGSHYSYDISGNVKCLLQENAHLTGSGIGQFLKRVDYDYDLVSGKVNYVYYQKDSVDQFIHRYEYDDDNRITHVFTSLDGMLWDEDAKYEYYLHGPLARVELGQNKVQGVDYAYTLQGWMKGINSSILDTALDMGRDGNSLINGFSKDAYGYSLGYFYQDYKQIDPSDNFETDYTAGGNGSTFGDASFGNTTNLGLYNGNIRHSVLSMDSMNYPNIGYVYQYDQLNRLKSMEAFSGINTVLNEWKGDPVLDDYKELIDFDPNGNILKYLRRGTSTGLNSVEMDSLEYNYYSGNNKLGFVTDNSSYNGNYPNDIDDNQSPGNYNYDANGNLIEDVAEGLTMGWYHNGKLQSVSNSITGDQLLFFYDCSGNRISKEYYNAASGNAVMTLYSRDAQGNILATYEWRNTDTLKLKEFDIYGSSRLGILTADSVLGCLGCSTIVSSGTASFNTGYKLYELTNHLGNVFTTITDKKVYFDADLDSAADFSVPEIASQQDYYPFGMLMPGRKYSLSDYRYGFNGKENDDAIKGDKNSYDFGDRIYDPRIGRFLSIDKVAKVYPEFSPYSFALNNPIMYRDEQGKGANGGFSVINKSSQPIYCVGSTETVNERTAWIDDSYASPPVAFKLNPGERYDVVVKVLETGTGYTVKQYSGIITETKTGKTRTTTVGDVDCIQIQKDLKVKVGDETFTSNDMVEGAYWNSDVVSKDIGGGEIRLYHDWTLGFGMSIEGSVTISDVDDKMPSAGVQITTQGKTDGRKPVARGAREPSKDDAVGKDTPIEGTNTTIKDVK